ncbi:MAG: hypothetical protein ABIJ05_05410 [Patescibacteria group bacterium]
MEQENVQIPTQQVSDQFASTKPKKPFLIISLVLLFSLMLGGLVFLAYQNYQLKLEIEELQKTATEGSEVDEDVAQASPSYFATILERENIKSQKNINPGETVSSGFLNPEILSDSNEINYWNLLKEANAQENKEVPFLFYVRDKVKVKSLNLKTNVESELFDLRDFSEFTINEGTAITKQYFVNKDKSLLFLVEESLGNGKYEVGAYTYKLVSQDLEKIVSVVGSASEGPMWQGFKLSPDEKFLFIVYNNSSERDPFSDIPNPTGVDPLSYDSVYLFYNTTAGTLSKYKTAQNLGPIVEAQWNEKSEFAVINYSFSDTVFFKAYPDGRFGPLRMIPDPNRGFIKAQYLEELNKIFYISTGSTSSETTFLQRIFGLYDLRSDSFNDVSDGTWGTMQFIYDYAGNLIFDKKVWEKGVVVESSLNYYNLQSGDVKEIINGRYFIIGFNGDEKHLLVSRLSGQNSLIYELDLTNNSLLYLATAHTPINY